MAERFGSTTLSDRSNKGISKRMKCWHALFFDERFSDERSEQAIASVFLEN
ncbi:MAG: hypothetical protein MK165_08985 [Pirellulaceae bacterium]|nr:hypothetical protein [Pirellulaceae bacterium]